MKRSEALKTLSHQHHQGLYAALKLKRAGPDTAADARRVFLDFYEREGARHFRAEEELLSCGSTPIQPTSTSSSSPSHAFRTGSGPTIAFD